MSALVDVARTWTVAELRELPEDGLRYELVDGNLVVTPPTQRHQWCGDGLAAQLRAQAPAGWRTVTGLRLSDG